MDYKKLIFDLREQAEWAEANIWEVPITLPDNLKATADAIERLEKERDAAVAKFDALLADVSGYQGSICCYCKHYNRNNCEHFRDLPKEDGIPLMCGKWEWRGAHGD